MKQGCSRAFTLIELLVVVSIIALLISILLPSLKRARELAREAVCTSNMRQIMIANTKYALESKDQVWHANNWLRAPNHLGTKPGLFTKYVSNQDNVLACPQIRRTADERRSSFDDQNMFGGNSHLDTDYTINGHAHGAKLNTKVKGAYVADPGSEPSFIAYSSTSAPRIRTFHSIPIFIEESLPLYNELHVDARWLFQDQIAEHHRTRGMLGFLDGSSQLFKPPQGRDEQRAENSDLKVGSLYYDGLSAVAAGNLPGWVRNPPVGEPMPYGWVNKARPQ